MRGGLLSWIGFLCLVLFASCGEGEEPVGPDGPDTGPAQRTVLIYFAADNSLALYARTDIEEIKEGLMSSPVEGTHLLAYIDLGDGDARYTG